MELLQLRQHNRRMFNFGYLKLSKLNLTMVEDEKSMFHLKINCNVVICSKMNQTYLFAEFTETIKWSCIELCEFRVESIIIVTIHIVMAELSFK